MDRPLAALALHALLVLAACDGPAGTIKVEASENARIVAGEGGTTVQTIMAGGAVEVGTELPAATPLYPGADIKTRIASASGKDGESGQVIVMTTGDPVATVAAFYDARAKALGVTATMIVNDEDSAVRIYGDGKRGERAMVAISRDEDEPQTQIVIRSGLDRQAALGAKDEEAPSVRPPAERAKMAAVMGGHLQ